MNHPPTEKEEALSAGTLPGRSQSTGTLLSLCFLVVSAAHDASETAAVAETRTSEPTARTAPPLVTWSA